MTKTNTKTAKWTPLTRRGFYAKLRADGFTRSPLQLTRTGVTYAKGVGPNMVTVTIPKGHTHTAMVFGSPLPLTGVMYDTSEGRTAPFGRGFDPAELGLPCFLWVVLALAAGQITIADYFLTLPPPD